MMRAFEFAINQHNQPKHISDAELLQLIELGELVMTELGSPGPRLFHRGREVKAQLVRQGGRRYIDGGSSRYRFQIERGRHEDGHRIIRRIMRAKMVWLFVHRQLVPADCLLDHENEDKLDDSKDNIIAMTHEKHSEKHYGPACDDDF
jgi:hypothetical protein